MAIIVSNFWFDKILNNRTVQRLGASRKSPKFIRGQPDRWLYRRRQPAYRSQAVTIN